MLLSRGTKGLLLASPGGKTAGALSRSDIESGGDWDAWLVLQGVLTTVRFHSACRRLELVGCTYTLDACLARDSVLGVFEWTTAL